jgi:DNA-binding Xre family transcriptional regulator
MHITYKKLWKLLIDRDMNKQDLRKLCGLSSASIAKMGKCGNITTDVLVRICEGLHCQLEDIMELEEDAPEDNSNEKSEQDGEK